MAPTITAKQLGLTSAFDAYVFLPFLLDVQGANDQPAQSDLNGFTRADNVSARLGVAWTWDDLNSWTGTGQTGDACVLFDTDVPSNGNANYAICVRITNDASGANIMQLSPGSPIIYSCTDGKTDRCTQPATIALGATVCEVVKTTELFPGVGDDGQDVLAACAIDLAAIGNASKTNILNVCSFPSGSPNSNAFDCIVQPGAAFLRIVKKTTPDASGKSFSFTLSPAAANGQTSFSITDAATGDESTALIAVSPGNFSITEGSIPSGWLLNAASCLRGTTATGTKSGNAVTSVGATIGETTVCTFENIVGAPTLTVDKSASPTSIPETGGSVTFSVVVTNTSLTSVSLTTLSDDKFGNLDGVGTCDVPQTIAASGNYSCSFTKTLAPSSSGTTHKDTVSATVTNAGGSATAKDDAVVTYTDVAPTVSVTKSPSPSSVPESGGSVTYTVEVTNGSAESVTLTTLSDDKFGNLNGKGTCATGGSIAAAGKYSCTFSESVSGNAGTTHKNTVTATVTDDDASTATNTADATVTFTNVTPTMTVDKTASPTSVPETGANVTYTVVVTNSSFEPVQLTTLSDDKFGNLNGVGTCVTGGWIAAGGTYSCTFTKLISGIHPGTHTNVVTALVTDNDNSTATDTDDAIVTLTDVKPAITVTKSANPTTVPETGGSVTYTVSVKNDALESVTLTTLSDDKFADLGGATGCVTPQTIAAGATYTCTFSKTISGVAGTTHVNTITATATDNDGNSTNGHDDATVTFSDVAPTITVTKTPSPTSVPETGANVTFSVVVNNTSAEVVTLTTLTDNVYGPLNGQGTCATGGTIAAGGSYSCSFARLVSGNVGTTHRDTVTAIVNDDDNTTATGKAGAVVTFSNITPNISVTKTANPTTITTAASGTLNFTADRTFTSNSTPPSGFNFQSPTCDDAGANDQPAQVDLNCFNRADNVANRLGVQWSWDDINSWFGTGQTGDACALLDTDNDGNANLAVCARISNNANGSIFQVGGAGAADVYLCNDTKSDRCAKQVTQVLGAGKGATTCSITTTTPDGIAGGEDGADITATCSIDLGMQGLAGTTSRDLLNVCSFPSGEPNSNPFDCVVKVGAAFIQIVKATDVTSTDLFGFTLSIPATDGSSKYKVQAGVTTALLPVTPGTNFAITETMASNWTLSNVVCTVDGVSTGTKNVAQSKITGIAAKTGQTTICTFTNSGALTAPVTYTITVNNLTAEAVSLFSLNDDKFGNLNTVGTCATGGTIAGNGTYSCSFTKTLTGAAGATHTNIVTVVAKDDELNSVTKTASATVTFTPP